MKKSCKCKKPSIIKNKFISTILGTIGIYLGIGFILPISNFSVYITSNIHYHQNFVNMHYGYFLGLIFELSEAFSVSLGGLLENKIGFTLTSVFGTLIVVITNIFYFNIKNIWACYCLTFLLGIGAGISTSLLPKNLAFYHPEKKGIIMSFFGIVAILVMGAYIISGEKIISMKGETFKDEQEIYSWEIAERTHLYFMIGFFSVPIGDIIFLLFSYEYQKKGEINEIIQKEDNINENSINNEGKIDDKNNCVNKQIENKSKDIYDEPKIEKEENLLKNEENQIKIKGNQENQEAQDNSDFPNIESEKKEDIKERKNKIRQILKTFRFWRIVLASFFLSLPLSFMISTGKTFGALIGIEGIALQFFYIYQGIAMLLLGPVFGYILDKKNPLLILRTSTLITIVPGIILYFFINNTILFIISYIKIAIAYIAKDISLDPFLMEIYGLNESVVLVGIINGIAIVGEALTLTATFLLSFKYKGLEIKIPYKFLFIGGSGCGLLGFILFMFENTTKFEYENQKVVLDLFIDKNNIEKDEIDNEENNMIN